MKKLILVLVITASIAACGNNNNDKGNDTSIMNSADSTPTITSGNTNSTMGQEIHRDSVERSSDSTGNIHPADTTK